MKLDEKFILRHSYYLANLIDTGTIEEAIEYEEIMDELRELEKEYLIHQIAESSPKLSVLDYQTLAYFLEMKGEANVLSFTSLFNFYNTHKRPKELYETMIDPLIQKGVLVVERTTGKSMFEGKPNEVICISKERYTPDEQKIKRLYTGK